MNPPLGEGMAPYAVPSALTLLIHQQGRNRRARLRPTPGPYVGAETVKEDDEPFEEKMTRLTGDLKEQFKESTKLKKAIQKNIEGHGSRMTEHAYYKCHQCGEIWRPEGKSVSCRCLECGSQSMGLSPCYADEEIEGKPISKTIRAWTALFVCLGISFLIGGSLFFTAEEVVVYIRRIMGFHD